MIHLTHTATCQACEWRDDSDRADRAAEKHTKTTSHSTITRTEPA